MYLYLCRSFQISSSILKSLLPDYHKLELALNHFNQKFCLTDVVIFESSTFLTLCQSTNLDKVSDNNDHNDDNFNKLEKISNLVKFFKLSTK